MRATYGTATRGSFRPILVYALLALISLPAARAAEGNLRVHSPTGGELRLQHAAGWQGWLPLAAGTTAIWQLPAGEYVADFTPTAEEGGSFAGRIVVWPDLSVALEIVPAERRLKQETRPDDAHGSLLMLDTTLLRALPGDKESVLGGLDTHIRWRPGVRLDGQDAAVAAERREIVPAVRNSLGPTWLALSPSGPATAATCWNLALAPSLPPADSGASPQPKGGWVHLAGGVQQNSYEGRDFTARGWLARAVAGVAVRGTGAVSFSDLGDASPRATAGGVLPHNDAQQLDLTGRLEVGPPASRVLLSPGTPDAISGTQGHGRLDSGSWGLVLQLASRGWQRNHFLEIYRRNTAHAPYEESALFLTSAACDLRLARQTTASLALGYGRYLTRLTDGLYKGSLAAYGSAAGNGGAEDSGLYWSDGADGDFALPHVFDYYQRKFSETEQVALAVTHAAVERDMLLRATLEGRRYTYRRYEHFSPAERLGDLYENALAIGYDATGERRADRPSAPGRPLQFRGAVGLDWAPKSHWRLDASFGAFVFDARDSALVSLEDPLGENGVLDAGELRSADAHFVPEVSIGVRKQHAADLALWGLAFRRALTPPLEALYSPRAHLAVISPEGVMGNPQLAPERESGLELGLALPLRLAGSAVRLSAAAYAARLDDAIGMTYARTRALGSGADTLLATYDSGGTLRQWGLHLEGTLGSSQGRLWARLSYDLARLESDHFEPPLLDGRWIDPDRPSGEYESEGYGGALGGIFDAAAGGGLTTLRNGTYRPANLDHPHRLSLALVVRDRSPELSEGWTEVLTRGWTLGCLARIEAGRPYTQTYLRAAGLPPDPARELRGAQADPHWEEVVGAQQANAGRMPWNLLLDLALTRRIPLGPKQVELSIEALNLLSIKNAIAVYRATGEPDDDGCLDSAQCAGTNLPAGTSRSTYRERLEDPRHYDRPLILRVAVTLELI